MGDQATGATVVVTVDSQVAVVKVAGAVTSTAAAHAVADRVLSAVPELGPVIVDLSMLDIEADNLAWLVLRIEAAPHWHRFRLVDGRLRVRRTLRQLCRRAPVLPDVDTALVAARAEVPRGTPLVDIVDVVAAGVRGSREETDPGEIHEQVVDSTGIVEPG